MFTRAFWQQLIRRLKQETIALYLVSQDPRVSWPLKALAIGIVAYAISPIDLIPDFIPVIGYLDDLLLLPIAIWILIKLIPPTVMEDCRIRAASLVDLELPAWIRWSITGLIVLFWLGIGLGVVAWIYPKLASQK